MIRWSDLTDIALQGVDDDYPDMANAGIEKAFFFTENRWCTEAELNEIQDRYAENIQEMARGSFND